jgi:hypothetical protein
MVLDVVNGNRLGMRPTESTVSLYVQKEVDQLFIYFAKARGEEGEN